MMQWVVNRSACWDEIAQATPCRLCAVKSMIFMNQDALVRTVVVGSLHYTRPKIVLAGAAAGATQLVCSQH